MADIPTKIALDVGGGDNGPEPIIAGALQALKIPDTNIHIVFVGDEKTISRTLQDTDRNYDPATISVVHTPDIITMKDTLRSALKKKLGSSMWKAIELTVQRQSPHHTDATISTGNTGIYGTFATNQSGLLHPSLKQPAILQDVPLKRDQHNVLTDVGFHLERTPKRYLELALLGSAYAKARFHIQNPRIGLGNVGEEEIKGDQDLKDAFKLLTAAKNNSEHPLNFVGNVEGRDILQNTKADVVIVDSLPGNITLKAAEQLLRNIQEELREAMNESLLTKLGGLLCKGAIKRKLKKYSPDTHGGSALVGLRNLFLVCHGSASSSEIASAIHKADELHTSHLISEVCSALEPYIRILEDPHALENFSCVHSTSNIIPMREKD